MRNLKLILTLIFLFSLFIDLQGQNGQQMIREVHTHELISAIKKGDPTLAIIDARDVQSDDGERIPGAKIIPVNASVENITANIPDREVEIIVYCVNPNCTASKTLAQRLLDLGYKNVGRYAGGIEGWKAKGQKVDQGKATSKAMKERGPRSA